VPANFGAEILFAFLLVALRMTGLSDGGKG